MPEFYMIHARKIIKVPDLLWYLTEKFTKFPNFTWFLPEKMPEFYIIIARKIFFFSYAYGRVITVAELGFESNHSFCTAVKFTSKAAFTLRTSYVVVLIEHVQSIGGIQPFTLRATSYDAVCRETHEIETMLDFCALLYVRRRTASYDVVRPCTYTATYTVGRPKCVVQPAPEHIFIVDIRKYPWNLLVTVQPKFSMYVSGIFSQVISTTQHVVNQQRCGRVYRCWQENVPNAYR